MRLQPIIMAILWPIIASIGWYTFERPKCIPNAGETAPPAAPRTVGQPFQNHPPGANPLRILVKDTNPTRLALIRDLAQDRLLSRTKWDSVLLIQEPRAGDIAARLKTGHVDIVAVNSATFVTTEPGQYAPVLRHADYRSVLIFRASEPLSDLSALDGASVAMPWHDSGSGYKLPMLAFRQAGISVVPEFCGGGRRLSPYMNVILAVTTGRCRGGAIHDGWRDRLSAHQRANLPELLELDINETLPGYLWAISAPLAADGQLAALIEDTIRSYVERDTSARTYFRTIHTVDATFLGRLATLRDRLARLKTEGREPDNERSDR